MKIFIHRYELVPRGPLGKVAGRTREGALLRVDFWNSMGYADCHPWPELGDPPLSEQLQRIGATALTRNSLSFALHDAEARAIGRSLWEGLEIPRSHYLMTSLTEIVPSGFDTVKFKAGADLDPAALDHIPAKIRLDFNGSLTRDQFSVLAETLPARKIDFIEDPVPWDEHGFPPSPVPLALDRGAHPSIADHLLPEVLIIKPAISDWRKLARMDARRVVFTSYLDHPLGQLCAAYSAALIARTREVGTCGLLSHFAYEKHLFSEMLETRGNELIPPPGPGFGWGDALEKLAWTSLA